MSKRLNLVILIVWPILASYLSVSFGLNYLASIILFMILPSIYLSFLIPNSVKKTAVFSVLLGVPVTIIIDFILHYSEIWFVETAFHFRILGQFPIESFLWVFYIYFVILFHEYFFDSHKDRLLVRPKLRKLFFILLSALGLFFALILLEPSYLDVPYAYVFIGLLFFVLPTFFELYRRPKIFHKFFGTVSYFFYHSFLYEIIALKMGWWSFISNEYVGWVIFFGEKFPFEEFLFYFVLTAITTLSFYEFFDDDEK